MDLIEKMIPKLESQFRGIWVQTLRFEGGGIENAYYLLDQKEMERVRGRADARILSKIGMRFSSPNVPDHNCLIQVHHLAVGEEQWWHVTFSGHLSIYMGLAPSLRSQKDNGRTDWSVASEWAAIYLVMRGLQAAEVIGKPDQSPHDLAFMGDDALILQGETLRLMMEILA